MSSFSGIKITKDGTAAFKAALASLTDQKVLVGIPAEKAGRDDDAPLTNAEIGYLQETGVPEKNLPARPWLVPGVLTVEDEVVRQFKAGAKQALDGDKAAATRTLNEVGLVAQSAVKRMLVDGHFAPLAASTLAGRRRRGRTSDKPLIDTAQMLNAITYVIRRKGA